MYVSTKAEKAIEIARLRKQWIGNQYGVEERNIIWMGGNMFCVVKNGESLKVYA